MLNYQGRISIDGANYSGPGFFVFSIQDTNGAILWSSGDFPFAGSTNLPRGALRTSVNNGIYRARLGETNVGMPPLDMQRILASRNPALHVWFSDGVNGWQPAGETSVRAALSHRENSDTTISGNQADAILKELRELRAMVQRLPAGSPTAPAPTTPQTVTVSLGSSPAMGKDDAPLTLVEFTDFQCPFCRRAHDDALDELKKKYVDSGRVRLVSRNLPLSFHPNAEPAAHAALCAMQQNQFWPMRDKLFATNTDLSVTNIFKIVAELKLDEAQFRACFEAKTFAAQIAQDAKDAGAVGITGTPSFVLGKKNGDRVTGTLLVGAKPFSVFEAEIEKQLTAK